MRRMQNLLHQHKMPSVIYGGVRYDQVVHALYCKLCKDTIRSTHQHDFKWCSCGAVGIDGGISAGNRTLGRLEDMESRAVYRAIVGGKKVFLPQPD